MRVSLRLNLTVCLLVVLAAMLGALALLLDSATGNDWAGYALIVVALAAFVSWGVLGVLGIRPRGKEFSVNLQTRQATICLFSGLAVLGVALGNFIPAGMAHYTVLGVQMACAVIVYWMFLISIPADL